MQELGPENQYTRIPLIQRLIEMGWNEHQLQFKPEWRVPATPSDASKRENGESFKGFPVDLAIFDSPSNVGNYMHLDILVETKKPNRKEGINQLEIYMTMEPNVKLGIWTNGSDISTIHRRSDGSFKITEKGRLPFPGESLIEGAAEPLTWNTLRKDVEPFVIKRVFNKLLCAVVSEDTKSTRADQRLDNLCNILLTKIHSDKLAKSEPNKPVGFQIQKDPETTAENIQALFHTMIAGHRDTFENDQETIQFDTSTINKCVYELSQYRIFGISSDVASYAFQVFRDDTLKSGEGQYFTPLPIIKNAVKLIEIKNTDKVLDPACGTGGFLIEAYCGLRKNYPYMEESDAKSWAQRYLFGVDKDKTGVKLTKAIMLTIGDGSTNTIHGDSIRHFNWEKEYKRLSIALGSQDFSCILTNPPFGKNLKLSAADGKAINFEVSHRDINRGRNLDLENEYFTERELGISFIERCHKLLEPGGKLGIVLPETYLFSTSYIWLQEWIHDNFHLRAIINIPMEAFQGFCRAKTNLYILEKKGLDKSNLSWVKEGLVLIANSNTCGINKDGDTLYKVNKETGERIIGQIDDELTLHCDNIISQNGTGYKYVTLEEVKQSKIAIPKYYNEFYNFGVHKFCERNGFDRKTLKELADNGDIFIFHGDGSPSADQRLGGIPYIKVSDLRAGLVNINPTNMIPVKLAEKFWKGKTSKLKAYDLLSPERASKNIGDFCVLMPGQEQIVLTKEVIGMRSETELFDQFYLLWALSLPEVRRQWDRIIFMQTNREDVGQRFLEIEIPIPKDKKQADMVSNPYRKYYTGLNNLRNEFELYKAQMLNHDETEL